MNRALLLPAPVAGEPGTVGMAVKAVEGGRSKAQASPQAFALGESLDSGLHPEAVGSLGELFQGKCWVDGSLRRSPHHRVWVSCAWNPGGEAGRLVPGAFLVLISAVSMATVEDGTVPLILCFRLA